MIATIKGCMKKMRSNPKQIHRLYRFGIKKNSPLVFGMIFRKNHREFLCSHRLFMLSAFSSITLTAKYRAQRSFANLLDKNAQEC
mmetsp:Transcript_10612/g.22199  ORF Transcript_10612/g.22199 Transcript_10612/m.22199 type:complete len:85 (-) Transcript_10612:164-418(-)